MKIGYACINTHLSAAGIRINRGMVKKTYLSNGIDYAKELSELNVQDLKTILLWNINEGIEFYRMSSDMLPWSSDWFDESEIENSIVLLKLLQQAGNIVKNNNLRVTFHPDHFVVLPSPRDSVVDNSIRDLNLHGLIMDCMGLERTPYYKINIHCNGVYGNKQKAMDRFCDNFERLHESVQTRLTIENDDKPGMYTVQDLMYIHQRIGIPIVFDEHHFRLNTGGLLIEDSIEMAISTWPDGIRPVVHYSESKALHENNDSIKPQAHSDYVSSIPISVNYDVDVMLEAKAKEQAALKLIDMVSVNSY